MTEDQLLLRSTVFAEEVEQARWIAKGPSIFWRTAGTDPQAPKGEIRILRRWNSHTPSVLDVFGGGYILRWRGKGTVIDPGCGFIRMLQKLTSYGLGDIDMVVSTHDHIDHCEDLGTLVTLLREFNKWGIVKGESGFPRTMDVLVSHGVAAQFASVLTHPENAPFLRWSKILPPARVERVRLPPKIALNHDDTLKDLSKWPAEHLRRLCKFYSARIEDPREYAFRMFAMPARHSELLGQNTSMGLRFELCDADPPCSIVISGDTGVCSPSEIERPCYKNNVSARTLAEYYKGAHLLVLHVGTMEKVDATTRVPEREGEHLGLIGVIEILEELSRIAQAEGVGLPKLVVLTEWGYEFGRLGLRGRTAFTRHVVNELRGRGKTGNSFFAAVKGERNTEGGIPVIPADVNLRIRLPDLEVWSDKKGSRFVPRTQIEAEEQVEEIVY